LARYTLKVQFDAGVEMSVPSRTRLEVVLSLPRTRLKTGTREGRVLGIYINQTFMICDTWLFSFRLV